MRELDFVNVMLLALNDSVPENVFWAAHDQFVGEVMDYTGKEDLQADPRLAADMDWLLKIPCDMTRYITATCHCDLIWGHAEWAHVEDKVTQVRNWLQVLDWLMVTKELTRL